MKCQRCGVELSEENRPQELVGVLPDVLAGYIPYCMQCIDAFLE